MPQRGEAYFDDGLSSEELDIVCGVYKVPSSEFIYLFFSKVKLANVNAVKGKESELRSWWPCPHTWEVSGLEFGYWTPWCENWFQKRLLQIRNGEGSPLGSRDCRHALKMFKGVGLLRDAVVNASEGFLQDGLRVATVK